MDTVTSMYYRDSDACILVFDMTERESFKNIASVWNNAVDQKGPKTLVKVLVGNKSDEEENLRVTKEEMEKMAQEIGALSYVVSAKKNRGLNEVFQKIGEQLI